MLASCEDDLEAADNLLSWPAVAPSVGRAVDVAVLCASRREEKCRDVMQGRRRAARRFVAASQAMAWTEGEAKGGATPLWRRQPAGPKALDQFGHGLAHRGQMCERGEALLDWSDAPAVPDGSSGKWRSVADWWEMRSSCPLLVSSRDKETGRCSRCVAESRLVSRCAVICIHTVTALLSPSWLVARRGQGKPKDR